MAVEIRAGGGLAFAQSLSQLLGTAPLQLGSQTSALSTRLYQMHAIYSFVIITTSSIMCYTGFILDIYNNIKNTDKLIFGAGTKIDFLTWITQLTLPVLIAIVGAWTGGGRVSRVRQLLQQITKANFGIKTNMILYEIKRIAASLLLLAIFTIMQYLNWVAVVKMVTLNNKSLFVMYLNFPYLILHFTTIAMKLEFIFIMYTFYDTMEFLNKVLKKMLKNIHKTRPLTNAEEEHLKLISRMYLCIAEKVAQFNQADGWPLLLLLLFCLQNLIHSINTSIKTLFLVGFNGKFLSLQWKSLLWSTLYIASMAALVEPCHQFQKEVEKMRVLVTTLMYRSQAAGERTALVVHVLCNHLMLDAPTFTPLGMFPLTRSLLTTIIGAAMTCIMFILQSSQSKHETDV